MEYKSTFDKTFNEVQSKIKEELIKAKSEFRTFNFAFNSIIKNNQELINKSLIRSDNSLIILEAKYKKSLSSYSENRVELALKNDVYPEYIKLNADELPSNYSFQNFVFDLAALYGLTEVDRLFSNQSRLFEMMFELNDFTNFEIKEYDTVLDNTKLFKKLQQRLYPEIKNAGKVKKYVEQTSPIDSKFTLLTNEEKILLLNIAYLEFTKYFDKEKTNKIPLTDFARVIYLTKDCVDSNIFDKNYASRTFYKKLSKGNLYYDSSSKRNNIIASLLNKIKILNLNSLKDAIDNEKTVTTRGNKK